MGYLYDDYRNHRMCQSRLQSKVTTFNQKSSRTHRAQNGMRNSNCASPPSHSSKYDAQPNTPNSKTCKTSSLLSLELFHTSSMAFHKISLMCAAEILIGDLLQRSQYGQGEASSPSLGHFTNLLAAIDVELDLRDAKAQLQGRIKTRLSLASNGSLIASNAQQLALELVRNTNTAAGGFVNGGFSISLQTPPAVIDQPIQDVLDKLNLFMRIAGEAAKVDFNKHWLD